MKGGKRHDQNGVAISEVGTAEAKQTDEALEIKRTNAEGTWLIEVRPRGGSFPTVPRVERRLRIDFEAKAIGVERVVRCVTVDLGNGHWLDNAAVVVREGDFKPQRVVLNAPLGLDVLVRLQDEFTGPIGGMLYIRKIVVTQIAP